MKKENDIEDLFKEKFEDFEADVKPDVWKNVQTALKGFGLGFFIKMLINKIGTTTLVSVATSVVTIISTVMVMNWTGNKKTETTENKPTITQPVTEKTVPVVTVNSTPEESINESNKVEVKQNVIPSTLHQEYKEVIPQTKTSIKTDKKEIESVINKFSSDKPIADIYASPISVTVASPVSLINNGTGKVNKWTFGDSKKTETDPRPIHFYSEPGIYTVKLTSTGADGKVAVDSVKIEVFGNSNLSFAPTDFSPNGDGKVDEFVFTSKNMISLSALIFDNKGNIVYEKEAKTDIIWDGKNLKGNDVKEGMYFYILNAVGVDGKKYEQNGSINLTR